jgi:hypothetical protein
MVRRGPSDRHRVIGDDAMDTTVPMTRSRERGFHIKVGDNWLTWLDDACQRTERNRAGFLAAGAAALAEKEGITPPPARRS